MYSTSPSCSSAGSSSGRSSPEHHSPPSASKTQRSNSFLLPQFFFSSSSSNSNSESASHPVTNALLAQPPRRTSFGSGFANPGRFSALSALGFTGFSSSPPSSFASARLDSPASESVSSTPSAETPQNSNGNSTTASSTAPAVAPPAKRHLCFPDGMGGTMCVEVKDRSRRGSSVN